MKLPLRTVLAVLSTIGSNSGAIFLVPWTLRESVDYVGKKGSKIVVSSDKPFMGLGLFLVTVR